jgi:hypothetical protein
MKVTLNVCFLKFLMHVCGDDLIKKPKHIASVWQCNIHVFSVNKVVIDDQFVCLSVCMFVCIYSWLIFLTDL